MVIAGCYVRIIWLVLRFCIVFIDVVANIINRPVIRCICNIINRPVIRCICLLMQDTHSLPSTRPPSRASDATATR